VAQLPEALQAHVDLAGFQARERQLLPRLGEVQHVTGNILCALLAKTGCRKGSKSCGQSSPNYRLGLQNAALWSGETGR
jgi:hypothetical protein